MSNLVSLDIDAAHAYVDRMQRYGKSVSWNGWTIESFRKNPRGYFSKDGVFRDGAWGFVTSISPDNNGKWSVREFTRKPRS